MVARSHLETLPFATCVPYQTGKKGARIVIAQLRAVAQRTVHHCLTIGKLGAVRREKMPMDPRARRPRQPRVEVLEKIAKSLEHRIPRASQAILAPFHRKPALHV